ncbi:MAG: DUF2326 domain-containing protein [Bacteroidales bacterium]|jgi:uncharacterized protein YydD (DUF2326 family)|nr:DUF2326 domain-containing protein [Bacteroidales bacterium]
MQLIRVSANKDSFRPVIFNKTGLSFIVAQQENPGSSEDGKTYNGVGKSLLVRIINFCLGAKEDGYKEFCEKLPGWEFSLEFRVNVQNFISVRKTAEANKIYLNDEELSIHRFNKKMETVNFSIPEDIDYLSFRSLLPFFLRPSKESYVDCMKPSKTGKEYQALLYNAFLIGLDIKLAQRKYKLRKEQEKLQRAEGVFKDDSLLYDFMIGHRDVKLEIENINDQLNKIDEDLKRFRIAEDYHEIQQEADNIENMLYELNNEMALIRSNINNIEKSMAIKASSGITVDELEHIYKEVNIIFKDDIKKTLQDVEAFYKNLITSRNKRLSEQKSQFLFSLSEKNQQKEILQVKFDKLIGYLGEHQALDAFIALKEKQSDLVNEKNKLSQFNTMQAEYRAKERQTKIDFIELETITENYLNDVENDTKKARNFFRELAKKLYPQSSSGITINVKKGENQLAFAIDPRIASDASDGINNVKVFCYDLTILFEGKNHNIKFVFHDSRLFDSIDERQLANMFRILYDIFPASEKQYIATVNQNQLNNIQQMLTQKEYEEIITKNTILTLTDESDDAKLLGIKIDIGNR